MFIILDTFPSKGAGIITCKKVRSQKSQGLSHRIHLLILNMNLHCEAGTHVRLGLGTARVCSSVVCERCVTAGDTFVCVCQRWIFFCVTAGGGLVCVCCGVSSCLPSVSRSPLEEQ